MSESHQQIRKYTLSTHTFMIPGKTVQYRVIERQHAPNLPYFVGVSQGEIFLSEDIPETSRAPIIIHEIKCVLLHTRSGRCLEFTKQELEKIPQSELAQHKKIRIKFYRALLPTLTKDPYLQREIQASLDYIVAYQPPQT